MAGRSVDSDDVRRSRRFQMGATNKTKICNLPGHPEEYQRKREEERGRHFAAITKKNAEKKRSKEV